MTSISPPILSILELFKGPLAAVRFADIDADGLAALAREVEAAANEVEQQEAQLTELRQALAQRQEALLGLAQRALAYARVYAEDDEPLLEELNRISLPRAAKPRKSNGNKAHVGRDAAGGDRAGASVEALEPDVQAASMEGVQATPERAVRRGRRPASQPVA